MKMYMMLTVVGVSILTILLVWVVVDTITLNKEYSAFENSEVWSCIQGQQQTIENLEYLSILPRVAKLTLAQRVCEQGFGEEEGAYWLSTNDYILSMYVSSDTIIPIKIDVDALNVFDPSLVEVIAQTFGVRTLTTIIKGDRVRYITGVWEEDTRGATTEYQDEYFIRRAIR